jgi:ectoine hydroxylase-related dioxygenase (phytanoyl-CoA dioxygenase family)
MSSDDLLNQYNEIGYTIARNAIDPELAIESEKHVHWLREKHPDVRPEQLHHHLLVNDPFIWRLVGDPHILDIVEKFIGPNIALFAAHYIAKPPLISQSVLWHQDGTYWPLVPMEVTSLWVAGTDSCVENGCMRVIPGTHVGRLFGMEEMEVVNDGTNVLDTRIDPALVDESKAVNLELQPGDISIHNPKIIHGSNANTSDRWRIGLTLRYIPTSTFVNRGGHYCILLRGEAKSGVNNLYAERPIFNPDEHMHFKGCENWNDGLI